MDNFQEIEIKDSAFLNAHSYHFRKVKTTREFCSISKCKSMCNSNKHL